MGVYFSKRITYKVILSLNSDCKMSDCDDDDVEEVDKILTIDKVFQIKLAHLIEIR